MSRGAAVRRILGRTTAVSIHLGCALLSLALLGSPDAAAGAPAYDGSTRACLHVERVTAFAPRGEIYVELRAQCQPRHFLEESSRLAYVEVLASDLPPVGEDVRVFEERPNARTTLVFRGLSIARGDVVLVRLLRFGEILSLQSLLVP